jgi:tetratricopeptide (TPR) repeat protein
MAGLVWDLKGRHDNALRRAEEAVKYAMIDEMRRAVIRSNALLAHEHIVLGDLRAAESALEKNSLVAEEEGLSAKAVGTGLFWVAMAELHLVKGAKDLSEVELNNGLSIIDKNEQGLFFSALARLWFGLTLKRIGRTQEALHFLEDAAQRFADLSNLDQARSIGAIISDLNPIGLPGPGKD